MSELFDGSNVRGMAEVIYHLKPTAGAGAGAMMVVWKLPVMSCSGLCKGEKMIHQFGWDIMYSDLECVQNTRAIRILRVPASSIVEMCEAGLRGEGVWENWERRP